MAARAAVVLRWPLEQQICRQFVEAVGEVMEAKRRQRERVDGRGRGITGDQVETGCVQASELEGVGIR